MAFAVLALRRSATLLITLPPAPRSTLNATSYAKFSATVLLMSLPLASDSIAPVVPPMTRSFASSVEAAPNAPEPAVKAIFCASDGASVPVAPPIPPAAACVPMFARPPAPVTSPSPATAPPNAPYNAPYLVSSPTPCPTLYGSDALVSLNLSPPLASNAVGRTFNPACTPLENGFSDSESWIYCS